MGATVYCSETIMMKIWKRSAIILYNLTQLIFLFEDAVFVLVTVVPCYLHVQAASGTPPLLDTTYTISRTQDSSQVLLR